MLILFPNDAHEERAALADCDLCGLAGEHFVADAVLIVGADLRVLEGEFGIADRDIPNRLADVEE